MCSSHVNLTRGSVECFWFGQVRAWDTMGSLKLCSSS